MIVMHLFYIQASFDKNYLEILVESDEPEANSLQIVLKAKDRHYGMV